MSEELHNCVGLFGSYGATDWRNDIAIPLLTSAQVDYFDPTVEHWDEEARQAEAHHAAHDRVLLMIITGGATSFATLAESGWLALQAVERGQKLVVVIEDMSAETQPAKDDKGWKIRPNKTRALVRQHIQNLPKDVLNQTVFFCDDVAQAVRKAVELIQAA